MESPFSAYQYTSVYEDLGIGIGKLGCIMLDIIPEDLEQIVSDVISPEDAYIATDPSRHINGIVAGQPHITLLYGLLRTGTEMHKHVLAVLDDGAKLPKAAWINSVGYFDSPKPEDPYYCIVAHVSLTPEWQEAHDRLQLLPHINTFPGYKAHMTLAYIRKDEELRDRVVASLNSALRGRVFEAGELNLGDM